IGVWQTARLRIVVTHQPAQLDSSRSEVIHLHRHVARQFSLNSQLPLPNIRRRLVKLGDQNESGCAGALEGLIEAEIGPERFGRLTAADRERSVANDVEYGIADVAHVINSATGPQDRLRRERVRKAKTRSEIVQIIHIGSPAESAIADILNIGRQPNRAVPLVRVSRAGAHINGFHRVVPAEIDIDDGVVLVLKWLIVLPSQSVVHRKLRSYLPVILQVKSEIVRSEVRDGRAHLAFRIVEVAEQKVGECGPSKLCGGREGILRITAIEAKPPACHDAADLVVANPSDLTAELERVFANRPGKVIGQLDRRIVIDEWRIALLTQSCNTGDIDIRDAPVKRIVRRQVDPELFDGVDLCCARGDVRVLQPAESKTHIVYFIRAVDACVGKHSLMYFRVRIDPHVWNRKWIITVLGGKAVTEEPI